MTALLVLLGAALATGCAQGKPDTIGDCGNGRIDFDEQCDSVNLGGVTCATIPGGGFTGGSLACGFTCQYDTSECVNAAGVCGNGVRDATEVCDGLDTPTCEDLGFTTGTSRCAESCAAVDTALCGGPLGCGNGMREGIEACDGEDLGGATCAVLGYDGGELSCYGNCTLDESGCVDATCGNDVQEATEQCDGDDLASQDCASQGYGSGGTLSCTPSCTFDVSQCGSCGDGVQSGAEECDTDDFGAATCETLGLGPGSLACDSSCVIDTSGCTSPNGCQYPPFTEGFEGGIPSGWSQVDTSNSSLQWTTSSTAHGGSGAAYHSYDYDTDDDYLVTPCFDLSQIPAGTSITLTYWEQNTLTGWYEGHYVVYTTNSNPSGSGDFSQIQEMGAGSSSYTQRTVALDALAGQSLVRIGFRYTGNDADNWYIDDVSITSP